MKVNELQQPEVNISESKVSTENIIIIGGRKYLKQVKAEDQMGKGGYGKVQKLVLLDEENEKKSIFFQRLIKKSKMKKYSDFPYEKSVFVVKENIIPGENAIDAKIRKCLLEEGQAHISFNHPNIIRCYGYEKINDINQIIVMDCADKDNSSIEIQSAELEKQSNPNYQISESRILSLFIQITCALDYLHDKNVIHRDIKPDNILLSSRIYAKLADFGVTRVQPKPDLMTTTVAGTLSYMAPEEMHGEKYDNKVDIWSLGVMLYQLCTLKLPFGEKEEMATIIYKKILETNIDEILKLVNQSDEIKSLIRKMIIIDPGKRISAKEILKLPFIRNQIKKCLLKKPMVCNFGHKLQFVEPQINTQVNNNDMYKCYICKKELPSNIGRYTCKSTSCQNYNLCMGENLIEQIFSYMIREPDERFIDYDIFPYEIKNFQSEFEIGELPFRLYTLAYNEYIISKKRKYLKYLKSNQDIQNYLITENEERTKYQLSLKKENVETIESIKQIIKEQLAFIEIFINKLRNIESHLYYLTCKANCYLCLCELRIENEEEKDNSLIESGRNAFQDALEIAKMINQTNLFQLKMLFSYSKFLFTVLGEKSQAIIKVKFQMNIILDHFPNLDDEDNEEKEYKSLYLKYNKLLLTFEKKILAS